VWFSGVRPHYPGPNGDDCYREWAPPSRPYQPETLVNFLSSTLGSSNFAGKVPSIPAEPSSTAFISGCCGVNPEIDNNGGGTEDRIVAACVHFRCSYENTLPLRGVELCTASLSQAHLARRMMVPASPSSAPYMSRVPHCLCNGSGETTLAPPQGTEGGGKG
jgi:hypothetical protein